jgi:hypothetical protein
VTVENSDKIAFYARRMGQQQEAYLLFTATPTFNNNNNQISLVFDNETIGASFNPTGAPLQRVTVEYTTR